jgi:hypothetical protein
MSSDNRPDHLRGWSDEENETLLRLKSQYENWKDIHEVRVTRPTVSHYYLTYQDPVLTITPQVGSLPQSQPCSCTGPILATEKRPSAPGRRACACPPEADQHSQH